LSPGFWRLIRDWRRFGRESQRLLQSADESLTVGEYFRQHPYSREFREQYFLPMGSAVWSCPHDRLEQFPMRFVVEFYHHHNLLTLDNPPPWRVIRGGSQRYVAALQRRLSRQVEVNSPVKLIRRCDFRTVIQFASGQSKQFDHVVLACHADQALRMLQAEATPTERGVLSSFEYEKNVAVLHTDVSLLPRLRRAWASWNYHVLAEPASKATVTYNMNRLQGLKTKEVYCVTLNGEDRIDPQRVLRTINYQHPVFSLARSSAQRRHRELIDHHGISYCGAYWGNGFHEDGVNSALAVCSVLQNMTEPAKVANA